MPRQPNPYPTARELMRSLRAPDEAILRTYMELVPGDPMALPPSEVCVVISSIARLHGKPLKVCTTYSGHSFCNVGKGMIMLSYTQGPNHRAGDMYVGLHELAHWFGCVTEKAACSWSASLFLAAEKRRLGAAFPFVYSFSGHHLLPRA